MSSPSSSESAPAEEGAAAPLSWNKRLEICFERAFFSTRWIVTPIYVGLVGALMVVVLKSAQLLFHLLRTCWGMDFDDMSVEVLDLIDLALLANLLLIVMFAGYENFVSRLDVDNSDFPKWMGHVSFGDIKVKLMASIVAMSAIHLLSDFVRLDTLTNRALAWSVGIHMAFVVSGVLMAVMDRITESAEGDADPVESPVTAPPACNQPVAAKRSKEGESS